MTPAQLRAIEARIQSEREHVLSDPRSIPVEGARFTRRLTDAEHGEIRRLRDTGMSLQRIASVIGCEASTVSYSLSKSRGSR